MPSPTYSTLLATVSKYIDAPKARDVVDRQLARAGVSPDTCSKADLQKALLAVTTATKLYVADPSRREEMAGKISAIII